VGLQVLLLYLLTKDYTAPEVYELKYDSRCDLYSLGVIIYFIMSKMDPLGFFFEFSKIKDKNEINYSEKLIDIIKNLTHIDPNMRYSLAKVVQMFGGDLKNLDMNKNQETIIEMVKDSNNFEIIKLPPIIKPSKEIESKKNEENVQISKNQIDWSKKESVLKVLKNKGEYLKYASKDLQNDPDIVMEAVKCFGGALEFASKNLQNDKKIVLEAVKNHGGSLLYASKNLKSQKVIVLEAVKSDGRSLIYASKDLQNDPDIVMESVKSCGDALEYASTNLQSDRKIVMEAIKTSALALQFVSNNLKNDKDIVSASVKCYGNSIVFASNELQNDKEILLEALKKGFPFSSASEVFKRNKEIILEVVKHNGMELKYSKIQNDKQIVLEAIKNNGNSFIFASKELQNDKDILMEALKHGFDTSKHLDQIPKEFQQDKELFFEMVKKEKSILKLASKDILNDEDFILKCFKFSKFTLIHTPFFNNETFCLSLIKESIENFNFISPVLKSNERFLLDSLQVNANIFDFFNSNFKENQEFIMKATESCSIQCLKFISNDLKNDREFAMKLVSNNGNCLEYLSNELKNNIDVVKAAIETTNESHIFASQEIQYMGNSKRYTTIKRIAEGGEGIIYLVKEDDQLFAEKRIKTNNLDEMNSLFVDYSKLLSLKHENIFKIQKIFQDTNEITGFTLIRIIMDLYDGDLFQFIRKHKTTEIFIIQSGIQILNGLKYLHTNGIIHGDLKLENIFYQMNENGISLKIGDFGTSHKYEFYGSILNIAPEIILDNIQHNEKSDIFSFGGILWRMMNFSDMILYIPSLKGSISFEDENEFSQELKSLVTNLLSFDPNERKNVDEILESLKTMEGKLK
jgi:serine/threonine protein kinase